MIKCSLKDVIVNRLIKNKVAFDSYTKSFTACYRYPNGLTSKSYQVFSYDIPIAVYKFKEQKWYLNPCKYSKTTSRHQAAVFNQLAEKDSNRKPTEVFSDEKLFMAKVNDVV